MTQLHEIENIETQLTGKTLLIYWYLLTKPEASVRELERSLSLSSPSIASHHLQKLLSLGMVEKRENGKYYLTKFVPVGVLRHFVRFRGILLPRYFFLASFFTSLLCFSLIWMVLMKPGIFDRFLMLTFSAIGAIVCWWETYRLYRLKIL